MESLRVNVIDANKFVFHKNLAILWFWNGEIGLALQNICSTSFLDTNGLCGGEKQTVSDRLNCIFRKGFYS